MREAPAHPPGYYGRPRGEVHQAKQGNKKVGETFTYSTRRVDFPVSSVLAPQRVASSV